MKVIIPLLDTMLAPYAELLGEDFTAYRNHACRVATFHCLLQPVAEQDHVRLAAAAAYHDLGIWTAGTFDYIEPSVQLAASCLRAQDRWDLIDEVVEMISNHHKLTPCCDRVQSAAETFRRADWMDVSAGLLRFGVSRDSASAVVRDFPRKGFHKVLLKMSLKRAVTHPLSPLPMLRW